MRSAGTGAQGPGEQGCFLSIRPSLSFLPIFALDQRPGKKSTFQNVRNPQKAQFTRQYFLKLRQWERGGQHPKFQEWKEPMDILVAVLELWQGIC